MSTFRTHYVDIRDPLQAARITSQLRDCGLATFSGITGRSELVAAARRLLAIRPHRDAGPDGVTVIAAAGLAPAAPGYGAFTDTGLDPHTDGSSLPDPPGMMMLACLRAAGDGGETLIVDGAAVIETLAERCPGALQALSAPEAGAFGAGGGYLGPVCAPTAAGRVTVRLRLDNLVRFSDESAAVLPLLRKAIDQHTRLVRLDGGQGLILSNTRWLHGRHSYAGQRVMLRVLGDPLPATGIRPGFLFLPAAEPPCTTRPV